MCEDCSSWAFRLHRQKHTHTAVFPPLRWAEGPTVIEDYRLQPRPAEQRGMDAVPAGDRGIVLV